MRRAPLLALPAVASLVLVGCGPDDPVAPDPETAPVTALIDGELFIAESAVVDRSGFEVSIAASASGQRSIGFDFPDQGSANYLIGPGNPVSARVTIGNSTWLAGEAIGSGTITVTTLTQARIEGSFRFTLVGGPNPAAREVTNGRFVIDLF